MSLERLREFWAERAARERVLLAGGAAAIALVALYLFLWQPGLAAGRRLSATLPKLRAQVELMRVQQSQIAALRKSAAAAGQSGELRLVLQAALASAPFQKSVQRFELPSAERASLHVASARFEDWLRWVSELQRHSGVRLDRCGVNPLGEPGMVRIEATLVGPGAAANR
jgi:general secretion pathway protein M